MSLDGLESPYTYSPGAINRAVPTRSTSAPDEPASVLPNGPHTPATGTQGKMAEGRQAAASAGIELEVIDRFYVGAVARQISGTDRSLEPAVGGVVLFDWPVFALRDVASNVGSATSVSGNVLTKDFLRNEVLEVALVAGPRYGTVSLDVGGDFVYQIDFTDPELAQIIANGEITDSFVYRVDDSESDSGYAGSM